MHGDRAAQRTHSEQQSETHSFSYHTEIANDQSERASKHFMLINVNAQALYSLDCKQRFLRTVRFENLKK